MISFPSPFARGGRAHFHSGSQDSAANDRSYLFCYFIYLFCVAGSEREREKGRFGYFLSILEKRDEGVDGPNSKRHSPRGLCRRHLTPTPPIYIHICTRLRWRKSFVNKSVTLVAELFGVATSDDPNSTVGSRQIRY